MRRYFAPAIAIAMIMPAILSARSDDVPTLDVRPVCRGIASQSELEAGLQRTNFEQCVQSEQATREQLKKEWSDFTTADKSHCVSLAKTGGESSYTELVTCMEMARDVRQLHSQGNISSEPRQQAPAPGDTSSVPAEQGAIPPSPVGHRQPTESSTPTLSAAPAPAASSQPPSTNKPPIGADSTLKELERVKADAQKARASEATVRGNLASAQAELQRTKEELQRTKDAAARATKQADQAQADAQAAREAQAKAENKFHDANDARAAAEERLKASESAPKNQPGFGAWLRGLFGHKPSNQ
jgi:transcription elongation factor